ncbi:pleiotropic drug resistance protein 1-like [Impatiens glandulifera]|uniref:pleiotropic drug resistance protein 1-like n=1 Tax=Impatiens glandulifera TaxID=253017 RepID=UPI001FB06EA3|nr:pleiotropic drug resistance protein 1-like [Impatiens glandulifera]
MESGDGLRMNSTRLGSSRMFRGSNRELFSTSIRDEDDEEALKWAAIEKLPTYLRIRRGVLTEDSNQPREIDIADLEQLEKKNILEKLVKVANEDNEKFLRKLKQRIDRVGIELPKIEVRFEHLKVDAEAYVGSRALPTVFNFFKNILEGFLNVLHILPTRKKPFTILNDLSGIIKPGRMTLLLGPPSSGKTTLLLALAGKLSSELKVSGRVTYNGHGMEEFVPQRTSAYISQNDLHIGELTVRETLAFSARCQGIGSRYEMLAELSRREKQANIKPDLDIDIFMKAASLEGQEAIVTDYTLRILGLENCADSLVGDGMIRGISGGEKKRVTVGEMLVGPARALMMDEISTGLDSSTTFQIVNSIKQFVHILQGTAIISLLQPSPETYDLFDEIILVADEKIMYQGPRENVLEFFQFMGFKCPQRKGIADFLQEVTSKKDQKQYWILKEEPYTFVSAKEFADAFQSFHVGQNLADQLAIPFDKTTSHPEALTTKKYGAPKKDLLKACISREYLLMQRNSFVYKSKLFQLAFMAVVTMTVYLRSKLSKNTIEDGEIYMGATFYIMLTILFIGYTELAMTILKLPVFYKQRDFLFFPTWAYSLPTWILKIPISMVEVGIWVFVTYYVIGFDSNVTRFFKQYLLLLCFIQMASSLFRLMASLGRNIVIANTCGLSALLLVVLFSGFSISKDNISDAWIWGYWSSPMMYGQNAIIVNEFLGNSWHQSFPNTNQTLGEVLMISKSFFHQARWYWIGIGALIGYIILFNLFYTLALTYLNPISKPQTILADVPDIEAETNNEHGTNKKKRGMVLPFEPLLITFDQIRYSVNMPQEMKVKLGVNEERLELLKGVSGYFRPGILTALMGVSGAGKTTLMDVLAGRKTGGYIDGSIMISGYPKKQETFARIAGYCEQTDIHSPHVTIYESLNYSAWLRLPKEVNNVSRKTFVEEVMELVEITSLRDALVGMPGINGLSTEQRKRLTIAVELVANPSIIFMDEPTSGLDARAAAIVMRTLRNIVDTGRTIVCTIHQPSIDIIDSFDELLLLKRGGKQIYFGPLGQHSIDLINYFEAISGVEKIKDGYNPATWMLEVSSVSQETSLGINFADIYEKSDLYKRNKAILDEKNKPQPGSKDLHFPTKYSQSFVTQFKACLWKQHLSYWRNPTYTAIRIIFTTVVALIFSTIFWNLGSKTDTKQDLVNAMGAMYCTIMLIGVSNATAVQPIVSIERTVFYREKSAGMFSALPYAFAQVIIEIPHVLLQSTIYVVIVYSMIGFKWTAAKFLWYYLFSYLTILYFTLYGMMVVAVTPNHTIANIAAFAFYQLWNLFSGYFIPSTRIPGWWKWYYYSSPLSWTIYGLLVSQYGDVENKLESGESVKKYLRDYYDYKHDMVGYVAMILISFVLFFIFIFAYSIKSLNFQKR